MPTLNNNTRIFRGQNPIEKIYRGSNLIWPNQTSNLLDGLIGFFKLDGNGNDSFGANHLMSAEPIFSDDGFSGQAAIFNRNRTHTFNKLVPSIYSPTYNGFAVSFWMKRSLIGVQDWMITKAQYDITTSNTSNNLRDWEICLYSGVMYWDVYFPNSGAYQGMYVMELDNLPVDQWNHIVCTYDGSGMYQGLKVYTNGYLPTQYYEGTGTVIVHEPTAGTLTLGAQTFAIGNEQFNFNGQLDEIGFWSRELNQLEVTQLFEGGSYPFTNTVN